MTQTLYKGRIARPVVAANLSAIFMGSTLVSPLYPRYQQIFVFSELTLTVVYAVYVVGNLAALFLLGRLSDQVGRSRIGFWAIGFGCASTVLYLSASGIAWLYAARVLSGLAIGLGSGTFTAWIADLSEGSDKSGASVIASSANMVGLAIGPLIGGLLAQYAPWPLHLSFAVYLVLLFIMTVFIGKTRETIVAARTFREASFRPLLGVPREIRSAFFSPAITAFVTFAMVGFYASLVPILLKRDIHKSGTVISGDVLFELFLTAAVAIILTRKLKSRAAMLGGLVLLIVSLGLLMLAQESHSFPILLTGSAVSGIAAALGYRGSLQVVNQIAPADKRAEVVSSYLVAGYLGNSLPIIGIGFASRIINPESANIVFAVIIALLALVSLRAGITPPRNV